jgi:hypothetical protein
LPATYEAARTALTECYRVDECKEWADKAAALKSYAKQIEDNTLYDTASRIHGRAIKRAGELLAQIEPARGANQNIRTAADTKVTRTQAAESAGLSKRQKDTALRVAAIPDKEFELAIAQSPPPTVTELADRGKKTQPKVLHDLGGRSPADFRVCTEAIGFVRELHSFAIKTPVESVVRGASDRERDRFVEQIAPLLGWLNDLLLQLQKEKSK